VETKEQAAALLLLGCSAMQGYLFARPGADPREVADEATGSGGTHTPVSEGLDRWPVALDESVSRRRGCWVAWTPPTAARFMPCRSHWRAAPGWTCRRCARWGRMALVHDAARLMVDGCLPVALLADDRLRQLVVPEPTATASQAS
jgi:hypothetical protein